MTEETLTAEAEKPSRRWGRAEWGPFALFAFHVALTATLSWLKPFDSGPWDDLRAIALGVVMVPPLLCSLWAALAPSPLIIRLCSALSVLMLLVFLAPDAIEMRFLGNMVFLGGLFLLYWIRLSMMRLGGGGSLVTSAADLNYVRSPTQFSIKDLLLWTSFVAILFNVGRYVFVDERGISDFSEQIWFVSVYSLLAGGFGLFLFPVFFVGISVLRSSKKSLLKRAKICTGIVVIYLSLVYLLQLRVNPPSPKFPLVLAGDFYLGAMLTMALSALVLRWSGYRLVRKGQR